MAAEQRAPRDRLNESRVGPHVLYTSRFPVFFSDDRAEAGVARCAVTLLGLFLSEDERGGRGDRGVASPLPLSGFVATLRTLEDEDQ